MPIFGHGDPPIVDNTALENLLIASNRLKHLHQIISADIITILSRGAFERNRIMRNPPV